jgi:hypothetical protein
MDGLSAAASVIAVLQLSEAVLGACYRYVGKVKGAEADINLIIHQIGYLSTILRDLTTLTQSNARTDPLKSLGGDKGPLAICARSLKEIKAKLPDGPVNLRQKLQWPFESKKINETMGQVTAQIPIFELALSGGNYEVSTGIRDSLEQMKQREEREKVLTWLRCVDPTVKHLSSRQQHQPDSNQWIIESESFKAWRDNAGYTLWLHGIAGTGKTSEPFPPLVSLA